MRTRWSRTTSPLSCPAGGKARTPPGARSRTLETVQQDAEREAIVAAIAAASGNKAQAARNLGISRASLYEKIGALGIGSDKH
jgi:DNA-binding NtrC family response regulator